MANQNVSGVFRLGKVKDSRVCWDRQSHPGYVFSASDSQPRNLKSLTNTEGRLHLDFNMVSINSINP